MTAKQVVIHKQKFAQRHKNKFKNNWKQSANMVVIGNHEKICMETIEMTLGTKERITIRLTKRDLDGLEKLVTDGFFNSRNEAVRTAIRNLIAEKEKENKQL
jgi:hypothetical protein